MWAFVSEDRPDTVTLVASWIPFEEPAGGPNFYAWGDGVRYDVNIDNDHDAKPDLTYRWVFSSRYRNPNTFLYNTGPVTSLNDQDLNFYQTYDLIRINRDSGSKRTLVDNATSAPSNVGALPPCRTYPPRASRTSSGRRCSARTEAAQRPPR